METFSTLKAMDLTLTFIRCRGTLFTVSLTVFRSLLCVTSVGFHG